MSILYVLKLENDCYYIGTTKNFDKRMTDHFSGNGALWTKKHKPIELVERFTNYDEFDEDKLVKKYMRQYGMDKVRGGSYVLVNLPSFQIQALNRELQTTNDVCARCNQSGHYANQCKSQQICSICGYNNHTSDNCYATTAKDGTKLQSKIKKPKAKYNKPALSIDAIRAAEPIQPVVVQIKPIIIKPAAATLPVVVVPNVTTSDVIMTEAKAVTIVPVDYISFEEIAVAPPKTPEPVVATIHHPAPNNVDNSWSSWFSKKLGNIW